MSRLLIVCFSGFAAACTYVWNDGDPALPLSGSAPSLSSLQRLNAVSSSRATLMTGADGAPWAAFCEFASEGSGSSGRNCKRLRMARLDGTPGEEVIEADSFQLHDTELYVIRDDPDTITRTLSMHHPGDAASDDVTFQLPGGRASYGSSGNPDVLFYWAAEAMPPTWTVYRRDLRYQREVPIPPGVDPSGKGDLGAIQIAIDETGDALVVRAPDSDMNVYSTIDEGTVPLGPNPAEWFFDTPRGALVTYGYRGIRSVPLDGSPEVLLSGDLPITTSIGVTETDFYYGDDRGLWRVPLDGSTTPVLLEAGAARARAISKQGAVAYGFDASTLYTGAAGDGWLDGWQFMERGRGLRFSADGKRLHFLEHAATLGTYGDLTTATDRNTANVLLGINVHSYDELPDGRLVAIENAIQRGTWNRLVLIDEARGDKRWLAPSTAEMFVVPGGRAVVAMVVAGADGYDIYRVAIP